MKANLKVAIELRGESVATVAVGVGIQPAKLSNVIQGHIEARPDLRRRLAEHLNADPVWLFKEVRRIPPLAHPGRKQEPEPSGEIAGVADAR